MPRLTLKYLNCLLEGTEYSVSGKPGSYDILAHWAEYREGKKVRVFADKFHEGCSTLHEVLELLWGLGEERYLYCILPKTDFASKENLVILSIEFLEILNELDRISGIYKDSKHEFFN